MKSWMDEQRRWGRIIACLCIVLLVGLPSVGYSQSDHVENLIQQLKHADQNGRTAAAVALRVIKDTRR